MRIFTLLLFTLLSSCVGSARVNEAAYHASSKTTSALAGKIYLKEVLGEKEGYEALLSQVTFKNPEVEIKNEALRSALALSLEEAGFLSQDQNAPYVLSAELLKSENRFDLLTARISTEFRYRLYDKQKQSYIFDEQLRTSYNPPRTAALSRTLLMRRAAEGALRKNFKELLEKLNAL